MGRWWFAVVMVGCDPSDPEAGAVRSSGKLAIGDTYGDDVGSLDGQPLGQPVQLGGSSVRIYVAAGPRNSPLDDDATVGDCRHLTTGSCTLFEVNWPLAETKPARGVREVVSEPGLGKPAVSEDGTLVAYTFRDDTAEDEERIGIFNPGRPSVQLANIAGNNPAWGPGMDRLWANGVNEIYWNALSERNWQTLVSYPIAVRLNGTVGVGPVEQHFDSALGWAPCDFSWPAPHPTDPDEIGISSSWSPPFVNDGDGSGDNDLELPTTCPWMVEAGPVPPGSVALRPSVGAVIRPDSAAEEGAWDSSKKKRGGAGGLGWRTEVHWSPIAFDKGVTVLPPIEEYDPVIGLAHLDISPSGESLLAFEQEGPAAGAAGPIIGRTIAFRRDGDEWVASRENGQGETLPAFKHRPISRFLQDFGYPSNYECADELHKYSTWCGQPGDAREGEADRYLVSMVSCGTRVGEPNEGDSLFSRVYLIDIADPQNPVYHDLVAPIETAMGAELGDYGAIMADCGPWQ